MRTLVKTPWVSWGIARTASQAGEAEAWWSGGNRSILAVSLGLKENYVWVTSDTLGRDGGNVKLGPG